MSNSNEVQNRANGRGNQRREAPKFDVETEKQAFLVYLNDPTSKAEYAKLLGPDVDLGRFISSTIDAVSQKTDLLNPDPGFRSSLFFSLKKAAKQRLEPDGMQGALIPRYNTDARCLLVQWQPMVKGVRLAASRAGIKKIDADFVLAGEPFRFLKGDEERIEHEWSPDIRGKAYDLLRQVRQTEPDPNGPPDAAPGMAVYRDLDAFWDMVVGGYCVITMPDGTKVRSAMPRTRILLLRDVSRSRGGSPWYGPFMDEMIVKSLIHFGSKRVPLESMDPKELARIQAFREAVEQDMEADFDEADAGRTIEHDPPPPAPALKALSAPSNAMDALSAQLAQRQANQVTNGGGEKVPVREEQRQEQPQGEQKPQQQPRTTPQHEEQQRQQTQTAAPQQQPANQGGEQTGGVSAGEQKARKFAATLKDEIWKAANSSDGAHALNSLFSNGAIKSNVERLSVSTSYRSIYREIISCCLEKSVLANVHGIETTVPKLYEDVMAAHASREQDKAA